MSGLDEITKKRVSSSDYIEKYIGEDSEDVEIFYNWEHTGFNDSDFIFGSILGTILLLFSMAILPGYIVSKYFLVLLPIFVFVLPIIIMCLPRRFCYVLSRERICKMREPSFFGDYYTYSGLERTDYPNTKTNEILSDVMFENVEEIEEVQTEGMLSESALFLTSSVQVREALEHENPIVESEKELSKRILIKENSLMGTVEDKCIVNKI